MTDDPLVFQALSCWPLLRARAGLPAGAWQPHILARRDDGAGKRLVLRMDLGAQSVVLKRVWPPATRKAFEAGLAAQSRAQAGFAGPAFRLARVLAQDPETMSCLVSHEPGRPLAEALDTGDPVDLLRRSGQWLATFHRSGPMERRDYQPEHMLRHLDGLLAEIAAGRPVARKPVFLACAEMLRQEALACAGRPTISAPAHGDLHMRNLLVDAATISGIDVSADHSAPVGHDIARLLVDHAALFPDRQPAARAFFEGYDIAGPDDPSVAFLMKLRILLDWVILPARAQDRRPGQRRRMQGLKRLTQTAFGI